MKQKVVVVYYRSSSAASSQDETKMQAKVDGAMANNLEAGYKITSANTSIAYGKADDSTLFCTTLVFEKTSPSCAES